MSKQRLTLIECSRCAFTRDAVASPNCPVCGSAQGVGKALPRLRLKGPGKMPALIAGSIVGLLVLCMCSLVSLAMLSPASAIRTPTVAIAQVASPGSQSEKEPVELGTPLPTHEPMPTPSPIPTEAAPTDAAPFRVATVPPPTVPSPTRSTASTSSPAPTDPPVPTEPPAPTNTVAPTAIPAPRASGNGNLRAGPGTAYPVVGAVVAGQSLTIVPRNQAGDWYQLGDSKWIVGTLVTNAQPVGVAADIPPVPTAPPTRTPVPTKPAPTAVPPPPVASGDVRLVRVNYDGLQPRSEGDEYVVIRNLGSAAVEIGGWRINAGNPGQDFTFPGGFALAPGQECRVYTNEVHPETCGFSLGRGTAIWNNDGDCGYLFDQSGKEVSRICY